MDEGLELRVQPLIRFYEPLIRVRVGTLCYCADASGRVLPVAESPGFMTMRTQGYAGFALILGPALF